MEIKVDRRIGYLMRAIRAKGHIDRGRAFARDIREKIEAVEEVKETATFWTRLLLTPGPKRRR